MNTNLVNMNKLQGFYFLQSLGVPAVPWQILSHSTYLDPHLLWTIRVAVERGPDMNLPRAIGIDSFSAKLKGEELLRKFNNVGIVVYYPYFIAEKSGTLEIRQETIIIEAVKNDLWNLTTYGKPDVTILIDKRTKTKSIHGDASLMEDSEIKELIRYAARVRMKLREYIFDGRSALLEWSYAINTDINHQPIGDKYLVFYEVRTIG
jgi:hypothetical protein